MFTGRNIKGPFQLMAPCWFSTQIAETAQEQYHACYCALGRDTFGKCSRSNPSTISPRFFRVSPIAAACLRRISASGLIFNVIAFQPGFPGRPVFLGGFDMD